MTNGDRICFPSVIDLGLIRGSVAALSHQQSTETSCSMAIKKSELNSAL